MSARDESPEQTLAAALARFAAVRIDLERGRGVDLDAVFALTDRVATVLAGLDELTRRQLGKEWLAALDEVSRFASVLETERDAVRSRLRAAGRQRQAVAAYRRH